MKTIKVLTVLIALMWVSIGQVSIAGAGAAIAGSRKPAHVQM